MLSKAQNKYIRSLTQQKYRKEHNVFVAEGDKIATEWLKSGQGIKMIIALEDWVAEHDQLIKLHPRAILHTVKEQELEMISSLKTPNKVLLVVDIPELPVLSLGSDEWYIALDEIQDPGNMGTIIRIADWFGIKKLLLSAGCADVYNYKVVQAAMGSHLRVQTHIVDLAEVLSETRLPIFAATLGGENVYTVPKATSGILVIGNEGKGVSQAVLSKATHAVTIPRVGGAESLNASVSCGILCALLVGR